MSEVEPILLCAVDAGIATLTLNRPAARNALSVALMTELEAALAALAADRSVKVVILAANGPAFCAGHDLKEMTAHRKEYDKGAYRFRATFGECSTLMKTIVNHPIPIIAQVQGESETQLLARAPHR